MRAHEDRPDGTSTTPAPWPPRRPIAVLVRAALAALIVVGAIASCIDWRLP